MPVRRKPTHRPNPETTLSLLKTLTPEEATGEVAAIYAQTQAAWGGVPNVMRIWSSSPFLLKQQ